MTETIAKMARRATFQQAKTAFANGAAVLVTERPEGEFVPVSRQTVTHSLETTTFAELHDMVKMWRNRYPHQTFYIVEDPEAA